MRAAAAVALGAAVALLSLTLLVLAAHTRNGGPGPTATPAAGAEPPGRYIVILGSAACPHCRAMEAFFEEKLPGVAYFCDIDARGSSCWRAFSLLVAERVTLGVPTIVVCDAESHRVDGIVVGEYEDAGWWRSILSNGVSTGNATTIPVYIGGRLAGFVGARLGGMGSLYNLLCRETLADARALG
ncbi:hypothetical protein CF15_01975 [Pyrodictium occultum]|uniref:Thioredoxin domain-containing protein n=1 Tax=Pyrodictium occultum TaxID=2309 RepID=A0A0V8RU83_PYROC|nr:hypothetical protein [Pyrodictium occultum]KSW11621.1 hypothetical protein CF15_01975 [Pyrodictium occultum]